MTPLVLLLTTAAMGAGNDAAKVWVDDPDGSLARSGAPACCQVTLSAADLEAAIAGAVALVEEGVASDETLLLPAQFEPSGDAPGAGRIWWLLPPGQAGRRAFSLRRLAAAAVPLHIVGKPDTGPLDLVDVDGPVLRYNYHTIEPGEVYNQVTEPNRIYARARSDYIHPLYGPHGEELTKDWSLDHPHHRGIYWAWPEVDYGDQRGDLHALQRVFARPTNRALLVDGPVYAQITAESLWQWEDKLPIVREVAILRAFRATPQGRCIDLTFHFNALADEVTVARRGTEHYGGLNVRCSAVEGQQITFHTDPDGTEPRMAWADLSGKFGGATEPTGFGILQHAANPDYPGDWVEYPNLNWFQPTFPAAKTRYPLRRDAPLILRFRLWIRPGGPPSETAFADQWRAYHVLPAPVCALAPAEGREP